jgi:hypothetical protein
VNLFDATDGTVIDGDAVGPADAETARRDFRETVLAYFETDADGGQIRCLFAANEGDGDARPVLAQARWDHDGYAGVDKPAWANFTQFVTGEIETSNWSFVPGDLTESVFRKLNNRTIDPTEAGDSQLDRPLDGDTAHIRAPSTATAVAVFNHFARQEYDVPFSVAVCESVPAHLQDSLTILVTTDDRLAKPVVERFETEETDQSETDGAKDGDADRPDPDGAKDSDADRPDPGGVEDGDADQPETDADDVPPAVGGSRRAVGGDPQRAAGDDSQPVAGDDSGATRRATDSDDDVPRGSPRADELPDHTDRGPDDGETSTGDDAADQDRDRTTISDIPAEQTDTAEASAEPADTAEASAEQTDTADAPAEPADTADAPAEPADTADALAEPADTAEASAEQTDTADAPADDLADEEFPLLEDEEADAFLSGEQPDATTDSGFESGTDTAESKEFDTTIDFEGGDFDADFDTDAGFDGEELGDDGFDSSDSDGLGSLDTDESDPSEAGGLDPDETTGNDLIAQPADDFGDSADVTDSAEPDDPADVTDSAEPDDPADATVPAEPDDPADAADPAEPDESDDHDPVAEFVAETETRPASDAIPEGVRDDTPPGEADDSDTTGAGDAVDTSDPADTEPESVGTDPLDTGPVGSTDPDFDEIDPDGSAVETTETHSGRSEAITGVAPEAAYELRLYSGPTGRLQYSTERESARVDSQAKWDYDNGLSLAVVPSEGVVRAYFNASRNGPEQFLAAFRCERVASEQLLETFVETLEATLAEQGWNLLEEAGGRQLLYNHMLTATPFDPDLSGADLADLLAEGPVDFVVPTHAKAVELFRWVREVADPETTIIVCGAGRTERTASADVVIQKDAGVGGVAVTGAAERRLEAQTLERAVRETTEAIRTVAEAVYREGGATVGDGPDDPAVGDGPDGPAVGDGPDDPTVGDGPDSTTASEAESTDSPATADGADAQESGDEARLDTVIVDLLNDRVPDDQPLAFVADGSRARRYETAVGWGVVGYAATATVSLLLALVVGALDTQLAGLGTSVPLTGTLVGGSDPPGWIPAVPLGVVLSGGLAVLSVAVAPSVASHPLARGLLTRVRSWWRYPPVSESALFDGSRIELLDATGAEETIESRLRRLGAAYDATQAESGDYRQFVADTVLTDPPLDSLSVAPRTETRRRQLSTVGGGAAVGVVLGVQTTVTLAVALGVAAATPGLAATVTLLFVSVVGVIAAVRRAGDELVERLSSILDDLR